jgi:regulator of cell morphogenesis and NO signaling
MDTESLYIDTETTISNIVQQDYRSADVFLRNGIEFSVSGSLQLQKACEVKGIDFGQIVSELETATKNYVFPSNTEYGKWGLDFLVDFVVNIHHQYLKRNLPLLKSHINQLIKKKLINENQYTEIEDVFLKLYRDAFPHMKMEEEVYFPYVKQIFHAYNGKETYARLMVRTLRKPIENVMLWEHKEIEKKLHRLRDLTFDYKVPLNAPILLHVVYSKLKEMDKDITQHIYIENNFIFPVAITMEKELLKQ